MKRVLGVDLPKRLQAAVLARFVHRFTVDHKPAWASAARPDGSCYKPQFASDQEWLENTLFYVTDKGELSEQQRFCESNPTFPFGI